MTERKARDEGLTFTGFYTSENKEWSKAEAKRLRGLGFRAFVVEKYSKGRAGTGRTGWSVWAQREALNA